MKGYPIDIITVAQEHRSGGREIARRIGERLGWPVLADATIVHAAARRLGVDEPVVATLGAHSAWLLERAGAEFLFGAWDAPAGFAPEYPTADDVASAVAAVVEEAALNPPLVIIEHGAQCVLRSWKGVLHVNVVAPLADRVARECVETRVTPAYALARMGRLDHERAAFLRRHFKTDCADPLLYDLQLNTASLSVEEAAELVVAVVERRGAR